MGSDAHAAILARKNNECWYLVRNLVVVLAQQQDPGLTRKLYAHIDYPHPRVHQEILKLMFACNRPRAERLLLEELQSRDVSTQLCAAQVADRRRDKAVQRQLLNILNDSALNEQRLELKIAVLQALAKIGDSGTVALPEGLINSGNLLHPRCFRRLRIEVIKTLCQYPAKAAAPLLEQLTKTARGEVAEIATRQLRLLRRKRSMTPRLENIHAFIRRLTTAAANASLYSLEHPQVSHLV